MSSKSKIKVELKTLARDIKSWGTELGFQQTGITDPTLSRAEGFLQQWLSAGYHGDMDWMASHGTKRSQPAQLVPGTIRVISVRMDYLPQTRFPPTEMLEQNDHGYISCYALGRDYHKLLRKRLQQLANRIEKQVGKFGYRVFVDSAPVMEKPLAEKAGLGWLGKHTNLINKDAGSWFFLGELYTDLALPVDQAAEEHCGSCTSCIDVCPTNAIVAPFQLDARLCISYLTIEHKGPIAEELRPALGNRIFGCDDCQVCCPWNKFASFSTEADFHPRRALNAATLVDLFSWDEATFLAQTEGNPIRRIGHERWLRNIAIALGNAKSSPEVIKALEAKTQHPSPLVREHVAWALKQH